MSIYFNIFPTDMKDCKRNFTVNKKLFLTDFFTVWKHHSYISLNLEKDHLELCVRNKNENKKLGDMVKILISVRMHDLLSQNFSGVVSRIYILNRAPLHWIWEFLL